jgi:hypothetical protein
MRNGIRICREVKDRANPDECDAGKPLTPDNAYDYSDENQCLLTLSYGCKSHLL